MAFTANLYIHCRDEEKSKEKEKKATKEKVSAPAEYMYARA